MLRRQHNSVFFGPRFVRFSLAAIHNIAIIVHCKNTT